MTAQHAKRCVVCDRHGCDPAHVLTRGAGNDDEPFNIMPLCRRHHIESGSIGWYKFCAKHPRALNWLTSWGWRFEWRFGVIKLTRD